MHVGEVGGRCYWLCYVTHVHECCAVSAVQCSIMSGVWVSCQWFQGKEILPLEPSVSPPFVTDHDCGFPGNPVLLGAVGGQVAPVAREGEGWAPCHKPWTHCVWQDNIAKVLGAPASRLNPAHFAS
jgi:hypothetical protein